MIKVVTIGTILCLGAAGSTLAQGPITGSTTLGTKLQPTTLRDVVGEEIVVLDHLVLNGVEGLVNLNVPGISAEIKAADATGSLSADLQIITLGIVNQRWPTRSYLLIEGTSGVFDVRVELDYRPGLGAITTYAAYMDKSRVDPSPYTIRLTNRANRKSYVLSGTAGRSHG